MAFILATATNLKVRLSNNPGSSPANPSFKIEFYRFPPAKEGGFYNSLGLYLQRSYTVSSWPVAAGNGSTPAYVVSGTTPVAQTGWTTIRTWSAAEAAALPVAPPSYNSVTDELGSGTGLLANQAMYAYRLIYFVEQLPSTDKYEVDYPPTSITPTTGGGGAPGSVIWATSNGGSDVDYGTAITKDSSGNSYVTGVFSGTAIIGGFTLISSGGYDVFLAKYNSAGACQFAVKVGATAANQITKAIAVDGSGNIYLGGTFATGFLVKCNSVGVVQWTHGPVATGTQTLGVNSIASDSSGNIVVTGSFAAGYLTPMDFGDSHPLTSVSGSTDAFLARYSTAGVCLWAQNFGNYGDTEIGTGVAVDGSGNIYATGYNLSGMNIGGVVLGNVGSAGVAGYLAKFDSNGNVLGTPVNVGLNGGTAGAYCRVNTIALDSNGDIFLGGAWNIRTSFGGPFRTATAPQQNAWIAKFSGQTLAWIWDNVIISSLYANVQFIATGTIGGVVSAFATGGIFKTTTFGPNISLTVTEDQNISSNAFVARYRGSDGLIQWAAQFGGTDNDLGNAAVVDATGQVIVTGGFYNNVNGTAATWGSGSLQSHGNVDCFVTALRA
jgi:hypothetical protein